MKTHKPRDPYFIQMTKRKQGVHRDKKRDAKTIRKVKHRRKMK